jgi:hypothetical protein
VDERLVLRYSIGQNGAVLRGLRFSREYFGTIVVLSTLLIIPCIWHRRVEAGDLPSHIYNAWLARLIEQGRAPGLYIVRQWNNVLFDLCLLYSTKLFGFFAGSAILVSGCALVFFWGVFSLVAVVSGRPPWVLAPCIAMFTYGYTFNMGFFNYYLSLGLACFGLAVLWRPQGWNWSVGALLLPLVVLAHPIGFLWLLGTLAYVIVRRRLRGLWQLTIPATAIGIFIAVHWYLGHVATFDVYWYDRQFYFSNGADQLVVYSSRYRLIAYSVVATVALWCAHEGLRWRDYSGSRTALLLSAELYLVSLVDISLLPQGLRGGIYSAGISYLISRLTIIPAVFALCAIGGLKPRKWASIPLAVCAAVFFAFLYQDTGVINRLESHVETITKNLPYGTSVIPLLAGPTDSRISSSAVLGHVVDRACIGHCFTYSNYEPSTGLFRVRVRRGSPVVTSEVNDSQEMEHGTYIVKGTDPPLKAIYQCVPGDFTAVCVRDLAVGLPTNLDSQGLVF